MGRIAFALLGMTLMLGACAVGDMIPRPAATDGKDAAAVQAKAEQAITAADWSRALSSSLRIRQNEYRPLVIALRKDNAYVLKLENGDDVPRTFMAPAFFRAIAVKSLSDSKEETGPDTALTSITLAPRQTRELSFVPLRDGSFPFSDGWAGMVLGGTFGNRGVVVIN